jgi:hypothetical protein
MARRYVRDNRGRFASVGATARGGRLRTASGNKRQTQTMQASAAPRAGAIRGKVKRDPAAASRVGQSGAAKPKAKTNAAGLTRAEFEAAAQKAWGAAPKKATKKRSQSADQQLDRLVERSGNLARSRTGLTKSEAMKASDLGKATGRNVQVSQNERGGYTIKVAAAAAAKPPKGSQAATKIEQAKGRTAVLTQSKNALNQQLKSLNAQIKAAGPSAGGLRLQKLQIQDRLAQVRRDITASKAAARG